MPHCLTELTGGFINGIFFFFFFTSTFQTLYLAVLLADYLFFSEREHFCLNGGGSAYPESTSRMAPPRRGCRVEASNCSSDSDVSRSFNRPSATTA